MAAKYHIKDDGTPGACTAASQESCPKTQAGDGFHGNLKEVAQESERRFEENYGSVGSAKSKNSEKPKLLESPGYPDLNSAIRKSTSGVETIAERILSGEHNTDGMVKENTPYSRLAYDLHYTASEKDRNYIFNEVPANELDIFMGEKKGLSKSAMSNLVKIHRSMVEVHGNGRGPGGYVQNRIPEDKRGKYISSGSGIGSLRPWGQPSNSIQNMTQDTGEMIGHYVIDNYGAERVEQFWKQASERRTTNRATMANIFSTLKDFEKKRKSGDWGNTV